MKTIELSKANEPLASYTQGMDQDGLVITDHGTPVAALLPIDDFDLENLKLSSNPRFVALLERASEEYRAGKAVDLNDIDPDRM